MTQVTQYHEYHVRSVVKVAVKMKLLIAIPLLLTLGSTLTFAKDFALENPGKRGVLRRHVRDAVAGRFTRLLSILESRTVAHCNEDDEFILDLQQSYHDFKSCINKEKLFITPKEDYINNIDECSKNVVKDSKVCFAEDQKYYPDLIVSIIKSLAGFFYDNYDTLRGSFSTCVPKIKTPSAQKGFLQCIIDKRPSNATNLLPSKEAFCKTFISASSCFTDLIKETCERSPELDKFREGYIKANSQPCDAQ